jgi:hypothetical protein
VKIIARYSLQVPILKALTSVYITITRLLHAFHTGIDGAR